MSIYDLPYHMAMKRYSEQETLMTAKSSSEKYYTKQALPPSPPLVLSYLNLFQHVKASQKVTRDKKFSG